MYSKVNDIYFPTEATEDLGEPEGVARAIDRAIDDLAFFLSKPDSRLIGELKISLEALAIKLHGPSLQKLLLATSSKMRDR
jgi:hypothetical protein